MEQKQKKFGLALSTLILGTISFICFPTGIAALITGVIALVKAAKKPSEYGGEWMAGVGIALSVIFLLFYSVIAAIAVPNLINAVNRGKERRTMDNMRAIALSWECYAVDNGRYCPNDWIDTELSWENISGEKLQTLFSPFYIKKLPLTDGWGNKFQFGVECAGKRHNSYWIRSAGRDGLWDGETYLEGSQTTDCDCDIVYTRGNFIQWPTPSSSSPPKFTQ